MRKENRFVFLYFGKDSNLRHKLFAEGFYHFPDYLFCNTTNPFIAKEFKL